MNLLTRSQVRFFLLSPWSTGTVIAGITLGIASIVAVHLISVRISNELDAVTPIYLQDVSYLMEKPRLQMDDYFDLRAGWRLGDYPQLVSLMPVVEGRELVAGRMMTVVGLDAFSGMPGMAGMSILPIDALVMSAGFGSLEDETLVIGGRDYRVAIVLEALPDSLILTGIGTAQQLLDGDDRLLSRIAVQVANPWLSGMGWLDRLLPGFSAGFEDSFWQLPGWQVRSLDSELPSRAFARSVLFNLGALGSLALVVSWLLVYQVGVIWLRRRALTMQRLSLMGVSRNELLGGFLASMLVMGFAASLLGLLLGFGLAAVLSAISSTGLEITGSAVGVDGWLAFKALASAAFVCLFGGWLSFRREWPSSDGDNVGGRIPVLARSVSLIVLLAVGLAGTLLSAELWAGFASIVAAAGFALIMIPPVLVRLRQFSRGGLGGSLLARIGLRELVWYPEDLAVAIGALTLALASSVSIGLMVDSFRSDFTQMLDQRLVQDVYIRGEGRNLGDLADTLATQPEVVSVSGSGSGLIRVGGVNAELGYAEFTEPESARYGLNRALEEGECLISERLARALGVDVDEVLHLDSGQALHIAGVFAGFGDPAPRVLVDQSTAVSLGFNIVIDSLSVNTSGAVALIEQIRAEQPELNVYQRGSLRERALAVFDRTFAITRALTLLALLVASVSLYNALLAFRLTQRPTLQLLLAMGVSRAEQNAIERWRALAVGLSVMVFALPLGLLMGWLLCQVINPRAFGWSLNLSVTWQSLLPPLLSAVAAIGLTTLLPTPWEKLEGGDG